MLPAGARLRHRSEFTEVVRRGRQFTSERLVMYVHPGLPGAAAADPALPDSLLRPDSSPGPDSSPRVGFIVSRAVGNAVIRNGIRRRLRHLVRERLPALEPWTRLVVRVRPAAAGAASKVLAGELDRLLRRAGTIGGAG